MVMKLLTPDINPKKNMVASSTVEFEAKVNTFSNDMAQHVLENGNKDLQGHIVYVHFAAQDVHSESENETEEKENNHEKCGPTREDGPNSVENDLLDNLAELKISVTSDVDKKAKPSSPAVKPEEKVENSSVSKEAKENASALEETVQSVTSKKHENSENKDDKNKDDVALGKAGYSKDKEDENKNEKVINKNKEDTQKCNIKQPKLKLNIPVDEVVEGIDQLKLTTKTHDENKSELISRGPDKGHQNLGNSRASSIPYSRIASHSSLTGGCIIAEVPASQTYYSQPTTRNHQQSSLLDEDDILPDEAERILLEWIGFPCNKERETGENHRPINKEQQVPYTSPVETDQLSYNVIASSSNMTDLNLNSQCLSPASSDDLLDQSLYSPKTPYRNYPHSLSTGPPSPLSTSTDTSSSCYSPVSSKSSESPDHISEHMFSLSFSQHATVPTDNQCLYPPLNNLNENFTSSNKPLANYLATNMQPMAAVTETKKVANTISCEVHSQNYPSTTSSNLPVIRQEPEIPKIESRSALERMTLEQKKIDNAFISLAMISDENLSAADPDGDTKLLIMVAQKLPRGREYLYALVKRLMRSPGALAARNLQRHSALLLACMYMPDQPLVARFIAEALQSIHHDLNEVYDNGNTIIHLLCEKGDAYLNVLVELLSMRNEAGLPCFDINRHNHSTGTPLLVAVKAHTQDKINCSRTIAFLLSQGANITETERCGGRTPLHIAIKESGDPLIVQILLKAADRQGKDLVNCMDYPRDTALHYAHLRNDIPVQQQLKIITLLLQYGASNVTGSQGRMPLALVVPADRKEFIRANTQRRNRKS